MKIISKRRRVVGLTVWAPEYGYVGRYPTHYNVLREETRLMGLRVWTREIDREAVSPHDKIEAGCLGGTSFVSRFAPFDASGYQPEPAHA